MDKTITDDYKSACKAIARILFWLKKYDSVCPDVGIGPFMDTLLDEAIEGLGFELSHDDRAYIIHLAESGDCYGHNTDES